MDDRPNPGRIRVGAVGIGAVAIGIAAAATDVAAAMNSRCLEDLVRYRDRSDARDLFAAEPPQPVDSASIEAYSPGTLEIFNPYAANESRIRRMAEFPATEVTYRAPGGTVHRSRWMGVFLTNKEQPSCIAMKIRFFAPLVERSAGVRYFIYRNGNDERHIALADAVKRPVTASQEAGDFYVINLTAVEQVVMKRMSADYDAQFALLKSREAKGVLFERHVLNMIRYNLHPRQDISAEERDDFVAHVKKSLAQKGHTCHPSEASFVCIYSELLISNELGNHNPFAVSDALSNSGLAFGPRQLDLGANDEARAFGVKHLVKPPGEKEWPRRYFKSIEQYRVEDLRALHQSVAYVFNARLPIKRTSDELVDQFIDYVIRQSRRPLKEVEHVRLSDDVALAARLIVIDFENKWGSSVGPVGRSVKQDLYADACRFALEWRNAVQRVFPSTRDHCDAARRARTVLGVLGKSRPVPDCPSLPCG